MAGRDGGTERGRVAEEGERDEGEWREREREREERERGSEGVSE